MYMKINEKYASFNRRFLACLIDTFIASLILEPLVNYSLGSAIAAPNMPLEQLVSMQLDLVQIHDFLIKYIIGTTAQTFILLLAFAVCWRVWSSTPGKMLCKIKVVDADSEAVISNWQAFLRSVGYIVSTIPLCLGFMWIGVDKRRQGWHDKMANTVVIRTGYVE
jgi:uncharacterized RDD family membrane protein YckC